MTLHIALYQPEIPPNTGNIIRLCANTGAQLHLIHPMAFQLDDKQCRRAGLDYKEWANVIEYSDDEAFFAKFDPKRIFACSTKGTRGYHDVKYQPEDVLLFGPETRGLPASILNRLDNSQIIRIPMTENSRSINLSNATAIIMFEAWRQLAFPEMN